MFLRPFVSLVLILMGIALILASGGGGDDGGGSGGRTFSLPGGIEVQQIIGDSRGSGDRCFNITGSGTAFFIYITLVNTTSVAIEVTIPAGLTFEPTPHPQQPQTMMVTQDNTFIVETGAHSFCVWVNCVGGRRTPRDYFHYTFGSFVEDECRWEIINLLRGKHLSAMEITDVHRIFDIIRNCPLRGLTDEDRAFLRSLP